MTIIKAEPANALEEADVAVAEALTPLRNRPLVQLVGKASEIGDQPPLYAITGAVIVAGLPMRDPQVLRAGARMLAAHALATMLKNLFKYTVDRTRPHLIATRGQYELGKGRRFESDYSSFPSGHSASSAAVARALGREYPGLHGGALGLAGTIAVTQVVRSTHFMTDIVAGAAIGLIAEGLVDRAFRRFHPDVG